MSTLYCSLAASCVFKWVAINITNSFIFSTNKLLHLSMPKMVSLVDLNNLSAFDDHSALPGTQWFSRYCSNTTYGKDNTMMLQRHIWKRQRKKYHTWEILMYPCGQTVLESRMKLFSLVCFNSYEWETRSPKQKKMDKINESSTLNQIPIKCVPLYK